MTQHFSAINQKSEEILCAASKRAETGRVGHGTIPPIADGHGGLPRRPDSQVPDISAKDAHGYTLRPSVFECRYKAGGCAVADQIHSDRHGGGCLYGAIGSMMSGPLRPGHACHCAICRKALSGAGSAVIWVQPDCFSSGTGEDGLRVYRAKNAFALGFCGQYGSTPCGVWEKPGICPTLGTLDGDPQMRVGGQSMSAGG